MNIDQIEDDTYVVYLDESDKNALYAAAGIQNESPAELLEEILLTCLHFICEKSRKLGPGIPLSPGMPGFEQKPDSSRHVPTTDIETDAKQSKSDSQQKGDENQPNEPNVADDNLAK